MLEQIFGKYMISQGDLATEQPIMLHIIKNTEQRYDKTRETMDKESRLC